MREPAVRSRLLELRRSRDAVAAGRDLLDRKREAIVRALGERLRIRDERYRVAAAALQAARRALDAAEIEAGRTTLSAAALAQTAHVDLAVREVSVVGVRTARVDRASATFRPDYGPVSGSERLDDAGARFAAAVPTLLALAAEEEAVERLRMALTRTARRLNAIDQIVLPDLVRDIAGVSAALEEEERDEAVRRQRWVMANVHPAEDLPES